MRDVKTKASLDKKEIYRTGGGAYKSVLTEQDAQILAMVAPQIQPLPNPYDDAAAYFGDTEPEVTIESYTKKTDSGIKSSSEVEIIQILDDQYITMANKNTAENNKPCTVTSINTADDQQAATIIIPQEKSPKIQTSSSAGQLKILKPTHTTVKQQYFRTKLRNAKLETKHLMNKSKMKMNLYKIKMEFWKLRLQKLKSKS
ncbi:unnamed protein product [Colias eurytheme]|nr:unnamed protein product [Colias eurytheme]